MDVMTCPLESLHHYNRELTQGAGHDEANLTALEPSTDMAASICCLLSITFSPWMPSQNAQRPRAVSSQTIWAASQHRQ